MPAAIGAALKLASTCLPSPELLPYLEETPPDQHTLLPWQVACHRVDAPIVRLNDIHFAALQGADDYQLGGDFLCWQQFLHALKGFIVRDQSAMRTIGLP